MPPIEKFTDEEKAALTPEELEGLETLEQEPDDGLTLDQQLAGVQPPEQPAPAPAPQPAPAPTPAPPVAEAPPAPAQPSPGDAPPAPAPSLTPAAEPARTSLPNWTAPADLSQKIQTVQSQRDELAKKFDDGELTAAEFRTQDRTLEQQERGFHDTALKAQMSVEDQQQTFGKAVTDFLTTNQSYKDPTLYAALDAEVRRLQIAGGRDWDPTFITQAHQNLSKHMGVGAAPNPGPTPPPGGPQPVPTLRNIPQSDTAPTTDINEFSNLDKLSGVEYDDAMARLTDAQRDRYLAQ